MFYVELEKDDLDYMDMFWCQRAQNIGLSNHKLMSAPKCTVWSQCTPVPDIADGLTNDDKIRRTHSTLFGSFLGVTWVSAFSS